MIEDINEITNETAQDGEVLNITVKKKKKAPVVTEERKEPIKASYKDVDPSQVVLVRNGFHGKLVYVSPRTHEKFVWDEFGDEQEIELREVRNAKSSAKKFFINNWFMFDDEYEWVIDYLGLRQYYKNAININNFDDIFKMSPDKIAGVISKMSEGQKRSLSFRARQLIMCEEIDSLKVIDVLEKTLGVELKDR